MILKLHHNLVYPALHGKWSKVIRFVEWLRECSSD